MNWKQNLLIALRTLIGDINIERYSDESLEHNLMIAAQFVCMDIKESREYTISLPFDITPSPQEDKDFILLVVLKSSCMISDSEYRTMVSLGGGKRITMKDGVSEITVDDKERLSATKGLAKDVYDKYADALFQFNTVESGKLGHAILGPYTDGSSNFNDVYDLIYNRSVF